MIDFRNITAALETQIKDFNTENKPYTIVRNKAINTDPNVAVTGWAGIYRDSVNYDPHSSGAQPWLAELNIRIEAHAASFESEEDCEERLDDLVLFIQQAIESNRQIGGYVHQVIGYNVDYDDNFMSDQLQTFLQFATITVTAQVRA